MLTVLALKLKVQSKLTRNLSHHCCFSKAKLSKIEIVKHLSVSLASISGSTAERSVEKYPFHQSEDLLTRASPYQLQSV